MYTIIKGLDGKFYCQGLLQDGTERWVKDTFDQAVQSMKQFARTMNGTKLKKKEITYLQPREVAETKYVPWNPWGVGRRV